MYGVTLKKQKTWELRPGLADSKAQLFPLLHVASVSLSIKWETRARGTRASFAAHCPQNWRKLVHLLSPVPQEKEQDDRRLSHSTYKGY